MLSKLDELRPVRRAAPAVAPWELATVGAVVSGLEHDVNARANAKAVERIGGSQMLDASTWHLPY